MFRVLLGTLLSLFCVLCYAEEGLQPLPLEQAFKFSVKFNESKQLVLHWDIAKDYYLYRDKIKIDQGSSNHVGIGKNSFPQGIEKHDALRGKYQVYKHSLTLDIPLTHTKNIIDLLIHYQGCSAKGFCYSPVTKSLIVDLSTIKAPEDLTSFLAGMPSVQATTKSEQDTIQDILTDHSILLIIMSFLGLGLLLAFTPCVLPMVPILSGIIMGHRKKNMTTQKAFFLSLAYVLGMAITYAIAGLLVALLGSHLQTLFQRPWVIILFSGIFVLLALSLFDVYQLRLPSRLQKRLTDWSHHQKGGTYLGVFLMGSISSLIASPCITPPLVGVLAYIAQTGNMLLGASALLALGFGMGIPLLLLGVSAGKFLPKTGLWMVTLERVMGWMMLAFAIWMVSRVIPGAATLVLWSIWLMGFSIFAGAFRHYVPKKQLLRKSIGIILFFYAIILMIGAIFGNSDPLNPWENLTFNRSHVATMKETSFVTLTSIQQLEEQLMWAKKQKKPVLIDFYADWCEACVHMERYVFKRPDVNAVLRDFVLLRADVTVNTVFDQTLMKRWDVIAPPTMIFFDKNGNELVKQRIVGEVDATTLLGYLMRVQ